MINENKIRQIYKSNREQGFQLLVECFQEPIYYYIRRLVVLHEDAEDVLQEVFIQVSEALGAIPLREFTEHMDLPDCNE